MVAGHLVFFEEHLVFGFVLEEQVGSGLGLVFGLAGFVKVDERVQGTFLAVEAFLVGEHGAQGERCTHGHEHFGVFRHNGLLVRNSKAFLEGADKRRVKGEWATFENHGRLDFHTLGKATDGLLRDGMETGKGDVFLGDTVVEHRLDVGFREHAATARNFVDLLATLGKAFEGFGLDAQKFCHLVNKCTGTAGAHTVHAHVGGNELAGSLVFFEEDDFGVLTTEFNSDSRFGVGCTYSKCVCDDFLYKEGVGSFGKGLTATATESDSEVLIGEKSMRLAQHFENLLCLHSVVALVSVVQKLVGLWIDNRNLHGGGTDVHTDP